MTVHRTNVTTSRRHTSGARRRVGAVVLSITLGAGSLVIGTPVATAAPPMTSSLSGLTIGSAGPGVKQVQEALIAAGVNVVGGADGVFGPLTASAVRKFQSDRGLAATGVVDDATIAALGLTPAPSAAAVSVVGLAIGNAGPLVKQVQEALIAAGVNVVGGADGVFGPVTASAVRQFQSSRGLAVTGAVDQATATALIDRVASATPAAVATAQPTATVGLRAGMVGAQVRQLQQSLLSAGLTFPGGADGVFGPATANALRIFQSNKGLAVTGEVDSVTAAALASPDAILANPVAGSASATRALTGLAPGSMGNNVRTLQLALVEAGIPVPGGADGIFGPATANAVKAFQRASGLPESGRVDEATATALSSSAGAPATPAPSTPAAGTGGFAAFGERGDRVRAMQQALIAAGVTVPGGADGIFGSQTAGAIMTFQRARQLPVTGTLDTSTVTALGLTAASAPSAAPTAAVTLQAFPVQGSCRFVDTYHYPRGGGRLHEGTDVMAPAGNLIYAVADGRITQVYTDRPGSLTGNGVRLTMADGTYFFYAHLQGLAEGIALGVPVRAGQILGTNGATGNAGLPHLHFEIHPGGGAAVNPTPYLRAIDGCARTDPLPQP